MKIKILALCIGLLILISGIISAVHNGWSPEREDEVTQTYIVNESNIYEEKSFLNEQPWGGQRFEKRQFNPSISTGELRKQHTMSSNLGKPLPLQNYTLRDPIRINNDTDLAEQAASEDWPGNGTHDEPYIIENYEIDGEGYGYGIYLGNITSFLEVTGCHIHNASGNGGTFYGNSGIRLFNTTNVGIQYNILINNDEYGLYITDSNDILVDGNLLFSNTGHEILLEGSSDNTLQNNIMYDESDHANTVNYCHESVLVKLDVPDYADRADILYRISEELANLVDGKTSRIYPSLEMAKILLRGDTDVIQAVGLLSNIEGVKHAEPNYQVRTMNVPNDPGYSSLWAMPVIQAHDAWNISTGSEEVVVAVIDTGIDYTHPDLSGNMWTSSEGYHGYNAMNDSFYPMDDYGHGTHVAGTIGAVGDNELGVVGVNWNVSLMAVKFLGQDGFGTIADAIAGLEYVLERKLEGENIVATSNSWGGGGHSELLYDAIEQHRDAGILFVAAAGNYGSNNDLWPMYPANFDLTNIISVAATDSTDDLAGFSNYGARSVHVAAPGVNINSTTPDGTYTYNSGTSMAVPHVSGLVALLASHNSSHDYIGLKNTVLSSVDQLDPLYDMLMTNGRINAYNALNTTPDPDDIRFWVHRPYTVCQWMKETGIMISLTDGVNPILGANVSVEFSNDEDTVFLLDDGSGYDQVENDGYYSTHWLPRKMGEITLTITAQAGDWEETREVSVIVEGDSSIALWKSHDNTLYNNTLSGRYYGIYLSSSNNNSLRDNEAEGEFSCIEMHDSDNNAVTGNTLWNSWNGVSLEESDGNLILGNEVYNNDYGIFLYRSRDNMIDNNSVSNCWYGILLDGSDENSVYRNSLWDNIFGSLLYESSYTTIVNNTFDLNLLDGIYILFSSDHNIIDSNTISYNGYGIWMESSVENILRNNEISSNFDGILMFDCKRNTLVDNSMEYNGIVLIGFLLENWNTHDIDTSNTVNDRPVYYWKDMTGGTVHSGAGQIILANCTDVTVSEQDMYDGSIGIIMGFSDGNYIHDNLVYDNTVGIYLLESSGNTLRNNTASSNEWTGIFMGLAHDNTLHNNTASSNVEGGITLNMVSKSNITMNTLRDNYQGVYLYMSEDINFYHNNFINNQQQVYSYDDSSSDCHWDNGYPSGGNYWSDHTGDDIYRGPEQDMPGSDGIVDVPYESNDIFDGYPLVSPAPTPHINIVRPEEGEEISQSDVLVEWSPMYRFTDTLWFEIRLEGHPWIDVDIDTQYEYTALSDGEYHVTVRARDEYGNMITKSVTFVVEYVKYIVVSPGNTTITAGESIEFTAVAYDEFHNEIEDVTTNTTWNIESEAGGSWENNVYTSERFGSWMVYAVHLEKENQTTLNVEPGEVTNVTISPETDFNLTAGVSQQFSANAFDVFGNLITDHVDSFTWENAANGMFNEELVGEYIVSATYAHITSESVTVTVVPAEPDHIIITPKESTVTAGESQTYHAVVFDEYGNEIDDVTNDTLWNIDSGAGGSWDINRYTSEEAGEWTVTADYNGLVDDSTLIVESRGVVQAVSDNWLLILVLLACTAVVLIIAFLVWKSKTAPGRDEKLLQDLTYEYPDEMTYEDLRRTQEFDEVEMEEFDEIESEEGDIE